MREEGSSVKTLSEEPFPQKRDYYNSLFFVIKVTECKTIFARMQDIKAGAIDEDGMSINNVEAALKRVKVELRDTDTSFRDMSAVLEELAGKWDTLNEVEQENIAKAIAGKFMPVYSVTRYIEDNYIG